MRHTVLFMSAALAAMAAGAGATPLPDGLKAPAFAVKTLSAAEFGKLHAAMKPQGERWTEIPWQTDLDTARERAARERKPLLMWVMDGSPLGCT
jgi:hypothetical protein